MYARFAGAIALLSSLAAIAPGTPASAAPFGGARFESARPALAPALAQQLREFAKSPAERGIATDVAHAGGLRDLGHVPSGRTVQVGFLLQVRNKPTLERLTLLQGQRSSPLYHHYLSKAQWNAYFAPDPGTYARTMQILKQRGFRIVGTYNNRGMIQAIAPAHTIENYFQTELHSVSQPTRGIRMTNVRPALMPAELRSVVVAVSGLHTIVTMQHSLHMGDRNLVLHSPQYQAAYAQMMRERGAAAEAAAMRAAVVRDAHTAHRLGPDRSPALTKAQLTRLLMTPHRSLSFRGGRHPNNVPTPLATTPPAANPSPDATEAAGNPANDYVNSIGGYDPTIYADAYDFPVQHGFGGTNHPTASVIEADYLDSDAKLQVTTFKVPRTGKNYRYCGDVLGGPDCDGTIGHPDPIGESTLDAMTIITLAPASDFYEYISPAFDDIQIEGSYELALDQDVADVVNSSFGGCETDDPSFGYAANYLAMEGAALGITFSASTGDTGSTNCGVYVTNGAPQTFVNISIPSGSPYFTAIGGTSFYPVQSCAPGACYTRETGWMDGGGGASVIYPIPTWQQAAVNAQTVAADVSTTMRNTPDVAFIADNVTGVGMDVYLNGNQANIGGTSVGSPMFTALQATINQVQNSRNGWVTPGLYAAFVQFNTPTTNYAFRDISGGSNTRFQAVPGYDDQTGLGTPLGWELAGVENGYPGATPRPSPATPPPGATPTPIPGATLPPAATPMPTPSASGTAFTTTTLAGTGAAMSMDGTGISATFDNPTAILYVASAPTGSQSTTDNTLFVTDYSSGFLRGIDLTTLQASTYETSFWDNSKRAASNSALSQLDGLAYLGTTNPTFSGLYVSSAGDNAFYQVTLPTSPSPAATPFSSLKALSGGPAGAVFNTAGTEAGIASFSDGTFHLGQYAGAVDDDLLGTSALPVGGNFGVVLDTSTPANFMVVTSAKNKISLVSDMATASTVTSFPTTGVALNSPREITKIGQVYYIANCGGNDILRMTAAGAITVAAGDGNPGELDGANTGAEFNCPFGITTDGTNLFVTDFGGNTVRKITNVQ